MRVSKRIWVIALISAFLLSVFIFNDSFRNTFLRKQAIHQSQEELDRVNTEIAVMQEKLRRLQNNPSATEEFVRRDLGYLKPGEKEVKFLKKKEKS